LISRSAKSANRTVERHGLTTAGKSSSGILLFYQQTALLIIIQWQHINHSILNMRD